MRFDRRWPACVENRRILPRREERRLKLTIVKHELRDWVESRLATLPEQGDAGELERRLNSELREAGLFCGEANGAPCPDFASSGLLLGFLGDKASAIWDFSDRTNGRRHRCGFDESAYVYG